MAFTDPGSFCWFELGTTDQEAAKHFYRSLLGWDVEDTPLGPGETYTTFTLRGLPAAATHTLRPEDRANGVPPNWMIYVSVESADDRAARAGSLGGTIVAPPFDVFDLGRMAVIQDPTGAMFSIWEGKTNMGAGVWNEPGAASWGDLEHARSGARRGVLRQVVRLAHGRRRNARREARRVLPHHERQGHDRRHRRPRAAQPERAAALAHLLRGRRLQGRHRQGASRSAAARTWRT